MGKVYIVSYGNKRRLECPVYYTTKEGAKKKVELLLKQNKKNPRIALKELIKKK